MLRKRGFTDDTVSFADHLSSFYLFGTAGFPAWFSMADHAYAASGSFVLCRCDFDHHCMWHDHIQPGQ